MKGKRFDSEFKKDIVKLYINGDRTCPSLAEDLGYMKILYVNGFSSIKRIPRKLSLALGTLTPMRTKFGKHSVKSKN